MKRVWVFHPFLIALWPILFIYSQNMGQLSLSQVWDSVWLLLGTAAVLFVLLLLLLRNAMRAGLLLSLFLFLFFSFTQVYRMLWGGLEIDPAVDRSLILMVVWVIIFFAGAALFLKVTRGLEALTKILNVMAVVLVIVPATTIGAYEFERILTWHGSVKADQIGIRQVRPVQTDMLPDIYYIILDGYARDDVLAELYHYDNSKFLDFLEEKGFFVARKSRANYAQTALSLASSLNLTYLDDLVDEIGLDSEDRGPLEKMIKHSAAVQFLKEQGYSIVAFPSGYSPTSLESTGRSPGDEPSLNEFEMGLLISTPIPWLTLKHSTTNPYVAHVERIRYTLDHLADTAQLPSPHFVFAHILVPHPPFVFDEHGQEKIPDEEFNLNDGTHFLELNTPAEYLEGYQAQLTFVNDRMEAVLDDLIGQSSRPTIIILQSDHGPGSLLDWDHPENTHFRERLSILNAYLLPGAGKAGLYQDITPVNTFRQIFDTYLGTELEKLEDKSYFSTWERPYDLIDVTDSVLAGRPASTSE